LIQGRRSDLLLSRGGEHPETVFVLAAEQSNSLILMAFQVTFLVPFLGPFLKDFPKEWILANIDDDRHIPRLLDQQGV
jgi:hypothetical protein